MVNAADYGVPQRRVRLVIIGFRTGDPPPFPNPSHSRDPDINRLNWLTLGETLCSLRAPVESEVIRPSGAMAVELATVPAGSGVKSPGKREATRPGGHWGYKQGAFVADLNQSARTVTASGQQDWIRDPALGLRRLSPRECSALQGFPESWPFVGSRATQYRLIGNAVPPPLAKAIGQALRIHIAKHDHSAEQRASELLPLPARLRAAIEYTVRDERKNGESRRASPSRRRAAMAERLAGR